MSIALALHCIVLPACHRAQRSMPVAGLPAAVASLAGLPACPVWGSALTFEIRAPVNNDPPALSLPASYCCSYYRGETEKPKRKRFLGIF